MRYQMELLLDACSGRVPGQSEPGTDFVTSCWAAITHRIAVNEKNAASSFENEEEGGDYRDDGGWEETKGDACVEYEEKRDICGAATVSTGARSGTDVALAASGERQLRVAGTFRRAIRASVSLS